MEPQELRLYNLLQYGNEIVPVVGIKLNNDYLTHLIQIQHNERINLIDSRKLRPIQLTIELMSKLGFEECYRSDSRIRYHLSDVAKYDFDLTESKFLEGLVYCGHYIKCQYLHQLQNLYFILTGEELKIHESAF